MFNYERISYCHWRKDNKTSKVSYYPNSPQTIVLNVLTRGFKKALESPHVIFERKFNSARQRLLEGAIIGGRFNSPVLLYNWTVIYYETSSISRNVVTSSGGPVSCPALSWCQETILWWADPQQLTVETYQVTWPAVPVPNLE